LVDIAWNTISEFFYTQIHILYTFKKLPTMSSTESKFVKISEDVNLQYKQTSPAGVDATKLPTLLFLHFWGGSADTWSYVIRALSPSFPTLAISFRGWGGSSGPDAADAYGISHYASDVEAFVQNLGLTNVILIGHSMGGKIATAIAGRRRLPPGVLKALVLVAPAPPGPLILPPEIKEQQIRASESAASTEEAIRGVLTAPGSPALTDAIVADLIGDMVRGNKFAKAAWPDYGSAEDIRPGFRLIEVPVLVLAGEVDIIESPEKMKTEIHDDLNSRRSGQAKLVIIKGSGHLLPIEKPDEIASAVDEFVQAL
jgi:pimeloyl-ACP methyl ester carboxylesterase